RRKWGTPIMTDAAVTFPAPSHRRQGLLTFDHPLLADDRWPYTTISGAHDGPTLCITAGIHGAEYPPIDAVMRFARDLDPARLHGRVVAIPVVNLPAFHGRTPFLCPKDGKNLNRVFPGDPSGTYTQALAHHLVEGVYRGSDALLDLHCGDLVEDLAPFSIIHEVGRQETDRKSMELALAYGLPHLIPVADAGGLTGTTISAAARIGVPGVVPEIGGIGQLQSDAVTQHLEGLNRALLYLGMLDGEYVPPPAPALYREFRWVRTQRGGFFRKSVSAGDPVRAGGSLGTLIDPWGEPINEITSPVDGVVLFVTTSPAMADDGLITGIGVV
ncbi:MAG TPA: M14 family metallopeptidase, partial [Chloroflexota bacterium]|nr:M14 family metallopeptidase [Chloroflexota bacterium]